MKTNITTMRTFIAMAAVGAMLLFSCCAGKKAVTFDELPAPLKTLITEHFPGETVSYATLERDNMKKKYDVLLSDGTSIEADGDGDWTEIESARGKFIPLGALPRQLADYLSAKHPELGVRKAENKSRGYEVELSNGLEIKFDNDFVVREYDH